MTDNMPKWVMVPTPTNTFDADKYFRCRHNNIKQMKKIEYKIITHTKNK